MPTATGMLPVEAQTALSPFAERATAQGAAVERHEGQVTIRASAGLVTAAAHPRGLQISVSTTETRPMAELVDLINTFCVTTFAAVPHWMGLQPPKMTLTELVSVTQISPNFRRLRLKGDFSAFLGGGSVHFRFVMGPEGAGWPQSGESGVDWPGGIDAWHRPPYTIVALDPQGRWLDTDVFLHDGGRVTAWTATAQPGDAMMIAGPGGKAVRQAPWLGLVGDETALPVILRALKAAAPGTRGQAFVLVPDLADAQPIAVPDGLSLTWVARAPGVDLVSLLRKLEQPQGPRSVFFAGERAEAAAARAIVAVMGLGPDEIRAANYGSAA